MATTRVGQVQIRLRVPSELEPEAARLRAEVERKVIIGVLEELERLLHATFGSDVEIRVRRLALQWSLDASNLADPSTLTRLAEELARDLIDELSAQPPRERLRPRSSMIAMFASERHADAARLADAADGIDEWFHAERPGAAATWEAVAADGSRALEEVLGWLTRMERVDVALALAPERALEQIAAAAPVHAKTIAVVRARRVASVAAAASRSASLVDGARATSGSGTATSPSRDVMQRDPLAPAPPPPRSEDAAAALGAAPPPAIDPARDRAIEATVDPAGRASEPITESAGLERTADRTAASSPLPSPPASPPPPTPETLDDVAVTTRYAGLFYLVGRVLEIELAERLWAAGVLEGDLLAHVARAIIDDDDDRAWRWFGGGFDRAPALPEVSAWAAAEVTTAVQHALGVRLAHFGVAHTPSQLAAELDRLATSMPRRVVADPPTARVIAHGAAALLCIVAARLGQPPTWPLLAGVIARSGHLIVTDDALRVIMPATAIDLDHRRAGLDLDPGLAHWMSRRVYLEFAGAEVV